MADIKDVLHPDWEIHTTKGKRENQIAELPPGV